MDNKEIKNQDLEKVQGGTDIYRKSLEGHIAHIVVDCETEAVAGIETGVIKPGLDYFAR